MIKDQGETQISLQISELAEAVKKKVDENTTNTQNKSRSHPSSRLASSRQSEAACELAKEAVFLQESSLVKLDSLTSKALKKTNNDDLLQDICSTVKQLQMKFEMGRRLTDLRIDELAMAE